MPSKSKKQARTMAMVAHDPEAGERLGIPQKVAREFHAADQKKDRAGKRGSPFETVELSNVASRRARVPETFGGIPLGGRARPFFTDD
jgi:hypothetical protein